MAAEPGEQDPRVRIARRLGISDPASLRLHRVSGGDICAAYRVRTDSDDVFVKLAPKGAPGMLQAELAGLVWIAEGGAVVPPVVYADDAFLVMRWIDSAAAGAVAARRFGRTLAATHAAGAEWFGQAPPDAPAEGWMGRIRMPYAEEDDWSTFYSEHRLLPLAETALAAGLLPADEYKAILDLVQHLPRIAGPPVPPARLHGDLWNGNLLWGADGVVRLVDPAAHGGHPEADLAMLALFGCPHLAEIIAGYQSLTPLPRGWEQRTPLHQVYPLLVHVALFGRGYARQLMECVRASRGIG